MSCGASAPCRDGRGARSRECTSDTGATVYLPSFTQIPVSHGRTIPGPIGPASRFWRVGAETLSG
jgi:hypothetical protein